MRSDIRSYHKDIYPEAMIYRAVSDYAQVGNITVKEDSQHLQCIFASEKVSPAKMANEFDNYLVELLNSGEHPW